MVFFTAHVSSTFFMSNARLSKAATVTVFSVVRLSSSKVGPAAATSVGNPKPKVDTLNEVVAGIDPTRSSFV